MKQSYTQIQSQIASLEREAEMLRKKEIAGVVSRIKDAIEAYGLTAKDLGLERTRVSVPTARPERPAKKRRSLAGRKLAVKYRDEAGNTWTGRGNKPRWLSAALGAGKKLEDFAV